MAGDALFLQKLALLLEVFALAVVIWAVASQGTAMLIRLFAVQSFLLACGSALIGKVTEIHHIYYAATFTFLFKVVLIPVVLSYIRKRIQPKVELPDTLNVPSSLILCSMLTVVAYSATLRIAPASTAFNAAGILAIALSIMLIGVFIMVNRRTTLSQIIGMLFMENGVFLAAIAMTYGMPLLVEFGIFFDVFVGILIMGTILFKINATRSGIELREGR